MSDNIRRNKVRNDYSSKVGIALIKEKMQEN